MNESQMREEFISKYNHTDQFTFVLLNDSENSRNANAEHIADWWLSQFQQYKASLIRQIEEMKYKGDALQNPEMYGALANPFAYNKALEDIKNKI